MREQSTSDTLRAYYASLDIPPTAVAWRRHLLELLTDWDRVQKTARTGEYQGKTLDGPTGGIRAEPRPCSYCRQPTIFTTPRGRSVHPACWGVLDRLTPDAEDAVIFMVSEILPITRIEDSPCLYDPAHTLDASDRTEIGTSPGTESANGAGDG